MDSPPEIVSASPTARALRNLVARPIISDVERRFQEKYKSSMGCADLLGTGRLPGIQGFTPRVKVHVGARLNIEAQRQRRSRGAAVA